MLKVLHQGENRFMRIVLLLLFGFMTTCAWSQESVMISRNFFGVLPHTPEIIQTPVFAIKQTEKENAEIRIRCAFTRSSGEPLWVIDGVPTPASELMDLKPEDIESVEVLKENRVFGCTPSARGVVIVTTKKASTGSLIIKDAEDGSLLKGATVRFINDNDTIWAQSDEKGIVHSNKLKTGLKFLLTISYVGYTIKDTSVILTKNGLSIGLNEAYGICEEVIVVSPRTTRCGRCYSTTCSTKCTDSTINKLSEYSFNENKVIPEANVFPNPASPEGYVTIQTKKSVKKTVELISFSGQLIKQEILSSNSYRLWIPNVSAGSYLIRITDTLGKQTVTKLLVQ